MSDDLVKRVAMAFCVTDGADPCEVVCDMCLHRARPVVAVVLEEAAKVVTEHYQVLCTEHRLLLVNRAAAIRALKEQK